MPQSDLAWAVPAVLHRRAYYRLHRDYYEGCHRLEFATNRFRTTFGALFDKFRDNLCPPVVNALTDRVQLTGWSSAGAGSAAANAANTTWDNNRQGRSGQVHLGAARDGDSFELVWPAADSTPRFWPQDAGRMAVEYDDEDDPERIVRAAKLWQRGDKRWRCNIYSHQELGAGDMGLAPGLIERWVTLRKSDDLDGLEKPAKWGPWTEDDEGPEVVHPWGVPVFHFPNDSVVGQLGRSELHDVVPLQDALNKTIADLLVSGEFVALPQRVLIGVEKEIDPVTGAERPITPGADRVWRITNPNGKVEEFAAADLTKFVTVADSFRLEICRTSGTPLPDMMLQGSVSQLSGEAFGHLEGRANKKAADRIQEWTPVHLEAMRLACRMAGVTDEADLALLRPTWEPVGTVSEKDELANAAAKLAVGYSHAQVLRELGHTDPEVRKILDERTAEAGALGDAMLASFDRGNVPAPIANTAGGG